MEKRKLFIFGNTDYASWAKDYFDERSDWSVAGFVVDKQYVNSEYFCGLPVIEAPRCVDIYPPEEYFGFVAIGYREMNRIRAEKMHWLKAQGYSLASYIDPSCQRMSTVQIGENCFIMENVVLQPRTQIGDGVCLGSGVCVGHDTAIKACSYIAIGAIIAGAVTIGNNCFVGANSTISNGLNIADYTLIGAGAYITKNTTEYGAYLAEHSKNVLKRAENSEKAQKQLFH